MTADHMIKTRLLNLVAHPGNGPAEPPAPPPDGAAERPGPEPPQAPPAEHRPPLSEGPALDLAGIGPVAITAEELDRLLEVRDLGAFLDRAYQVILGRPPDLRGAIGHARSLRFRPFYSRRKFLGRLLRTEEHRQLQDRRLLEQVGRLREQARRLDQGRQDLARRERELEQERQALARRRERLERRRRACEVREAERDRAAEQLRGMLAPLPQIVEQLRPLPGRHARLLEQHHQVLERHGESAARQDQLAALLHPLAERHAQLLEQQGQVLAEQATERERWAERADTFQQRFLDELRRALPRDEDGEEATRDGVAAAGGAQVETFVVEAYRLTLRRAPAPSELAAASRQLRAAIAQAKGDLLRALLGEEPPGAEPTGPDEPDAATCRVWDEVAAGERGAA